MAGPFPVEVPDHGARGTVRGRLTQIAEIESPTGIGNFYRAEVLFARGISPWQPAGPVPDLPELVELARRMLEANKDRTVQVTTGNPARGQETWVYGRAGRPCRRCGTPVATAPAERVTFWCPTCQPGPHD